jgi:hypothetical protein
MSTSVIYSTSSDESFQPGVQLRLSRPFPFQQSFCNRHRLFTKVNGLFILPFVKAKAACRSLRQTSFGLAPTFFQGPCLFVPFLLTVVFGNNQAKDE